MEDGGDPELNGVDDYDPIGAMEPADRHLTDRDADLRPTDIEHDPAWELDPVSAIDSASDDPRTAQAAEISDDPLPPAFDNAEIDERKIAEYAMNPEHPVGKHKYHVINTATGLGPTDSADIRQQIISGVRSGEPILGRSDEYGQRWSVDVELAGPTGTITVRTAWIIDESSPDPRMTTISFPPRRG